MPTLFKYANIRFYFYSNDHRPIHVHVEKAGAKAKIQVEGGVKVIDNKGFSDAALNEIVAMVKRFEKRITKEWEERFDEE